MRTVLAYIFCGIVLAVVLAACDGAPRITGIKGVTADYEAGRFAEAHHRAVGLMRRGSQADREEAAYLAGLSAFRLKDLDEAERRLMTAVTSTNPLIVGRSKATLGLIRMEQHRPSDAAAYFLGASLLLEGREAAEAATFAGGAYREAGQFDKAEAQFRLASTLYRSGRSASDRGQAETTLFAIQVGAFEILKNARIAQREAQVIARRHELGDVKIVAQTDTRARTLYMVQFGAFSTRSAAERMRAEIGRLDYIVTSVVRAM